MRLVVGSADGEGVLGMHVDALISGHLDSIRWDHRPSTVVARRNTLRRLQRWCAVNEVDLLAVTHADLFRYLDRPLGDGARAREISQLHRFFAWAVIEGHLEADPTVRLPRPTQRIGVPRPIPEQVLYRALSEAPERIAPWLWLAAYAGLRACEIAPLRAEHLWWHHDPRLILVAEGKGGDSAAVPMATVLEPILRRLPTQGFLFTRGDGQPGPPAAWNVSHASNRFLSHYGPYTLHQLRHRFGTLVHRASHDLRKTQTLMRHRSIVSTTIYTAVDQGEAAAIVSGLPAVVAL